MDGIEYRKAELADDVVEQLLELSRIWAEEKNCHGLRPNQRDDIHEPVYIALKDGKVIGYAFGQYYTREKPVGDIEVGERCFDFEELYVLPPYRSQGVGRKLFSLLEEEAKKGAKYMTLPTSNKDYKRILHFYIEEVGMVFHSAFLMKKLG